jgi:hypothetical protein
VETLLTQRHRGKRHATFVVVILLAWWFGLATSVFGLFKSREECERIRAYLSREGVTLLVTPCWEG